MSQVMMVFMFLVGVMLGLLVHGWGDVPRGEETVNPEEVWTFRITLDLGSSNTRVELGPDGATLRTPDERGAREVRNDLFTVLQAFNAKKAKAEGTR